MPSSLNKAMLIGNLGKDAETRHTPSGTAVTNFRLATTSRYKDQMGEWRDRTEWHDIVLWRAENVAPYLTKGKKVFVEGRLQTRSWEGQDGQKRYRTEVVCDPFGLVLLGGRDGPSDGGQGSYRQGGRGYGQGSQGSYGQSGRGGYDQGGGQSGGHGAEDAGGTGSARSGSAGSGESQAGSIPDDDDIPF